ncbi:MAG: hypothetical protein R3C16_10800 [Hyphomonadaceae bacterium]
MMRHGKQRADGAQPGCSKSADNQRRQQSQRPMGEIDALQFRVERRARAEQRQQQKRGRRRNQRHGAGDQRGQQRAAGAADRKTGRAPKGGRGRVVRDSPVHDSLT